MALNITTTKNWSDYEATSSTSLTINQGSVTALALTISTGKAYQVGDDIALVPTAAKIPMMLIGTVTSYDAGTGALVANITRFESGIPSWDLVSASTNTIGTGAKTFLTYNGKSSLLAASDTIMVSRRGANGGNRFYGTVTSYNNADGTLVMNCTATIGSGTSVTDWIITSAGTFSAWKIVPSPATNITANTNVIFNMDMEPSYHVGSFVSLDRGVINIVNASTSALWVIDLSNKAVNGAKIFQLENNGKLNVTGAMIQIATGTGVAGQTISLSAYPKLGLPAIEVETGNGTNVYRPWYVYEDILTDRGYLGKNWVSRGYKQSFDTNRSSTVTLTVATPTVITWVGHGLRPGQRVRMSTTGTYTGLTTGTDYYVQLTSFTTDTFTLATSPVGSTPIGVTAQSGIHTCTVIPDFGQGLQGNVLLYNPATKTLRCGNGTVGNVIPNGAKVRMPNIHFTMEYPRTCIHSAISSATAGNAVTFTVGNISNLQAATGNTFFINQEEFTGTFTGSVMTTTARALNGTIAANHAQGDTYFGNTAATATTTNTRALFDTADGGIVNLTRCSFGNVYPYIQNPQDSTFNNVWMTGACNIGATTANITVDGVFCSPYPQADTTGLTFTSTLGSVSLKNLYCGTLCQGSNANGAPISITSNQNATKLENFEGFIPPRNGTASPNAISISAVVINTVIKNMTAIGGRLAITNSSRFEVDGVIQSSESNGIASSNCAINGIILTNCQFGIFRNISKATNGAAVRNQVLSTDANSSNILFHAINYDCDTNASAILSPSGNNIRVVNGVFAALRDGSGTGNGAWGATNTATGDTINIQNCTLTISDTYGLDNGHGETARIFYEQVTGHSLWWRDVGNAFIGNYQEIGPFHVLLDAGTKASGTLYWSPSVKAGRDIYDLGGTAYMNNGGSVFLPVTGDYVISKSYQVLRTITGFTGTVTPQGNQTGNMTYEFELVKYDGTFTGTWTALTTANLNSAIATLSGYNDYNGLKIRYKITATVDSALNQVINIRAFTTNNAATVLPIGYVKYTLTGLPANTIIAGYDGATEVNYEVGSTLQLPYAYDGNTKTDTIRIRNYLYNNDDHSVTFNQYDLSRAYIGGGLDANITQTTSATVAAYTNLNTAGRIYDAVKLWGTQRANLGVALPVARSGGINDFGSDNLIFDPAASVNVSLSGNNLTLRCGTVVDPFVTTGTLTLLNGAVIQCNYKIGATQYYYATASVSGVANGSRIQVYNVTTSTEVYNGIPGTSWVLNYISGSPFSNGDVVRVRIAYQSGGSANMEQEYTAVASSTGWTIQDDTKADTVYNTYGVDGSTCTEFSWDGVNLQVDINDTDNTTEMQRIGAWYHYYITTATGIANLFGKVNWDKINEISIVGLQLDNLKTTPLLLKGGRIYRPDGVTVIAPTSNSIQIDYDPVYVTSGSGTAPTVVQIRQEIDANSTRLASIDGRLPASPAAVSDIPSAATNAAAVRTNLTTELGRIDVATSSRLAASSYVAAPTTSAIRTELSTELARIDANISSRGTGDLTSIAGDATAATNLKNQFNGTGLSGDAYPARQDQMKNITTTGSAVNTSATGFTLTTGTVATGTYIVTAPRDGIVHEIDDVGGVIDFYYTFNIGTGIPTSVLLYACVMGNNDSLKVYGYNFGGSAWIQIGGINGTSSTSYIENVFNLFSSMVDSNGDVRIRFSGTGLTTAHIMTDQIIVSYAMQGASTAAIRSELAPELARIDVATSTRLAASTYVAAPTTAAIRTELATELGRIDVAVSSRAATASVPSAAANATAVRSELAVELAKLDANISTRATATAVAAVKRDTSIIGGAL